jgi:Pyruvate/2-oxoacid:ferredoxin oxidoreductase gamma subunit
VERELLLTGIGGQGVQLAAQVIARAAALEGRDVSLLGIYGGMMRGGNTDSTVVIADRPIESPPVVSRAWSAIALHDEFWAPVEAKLRPGGLVVVNDSTFHCDVRDDVTLVRLGATEAANALGSSLGAALVMTGAFATLTGVVALDSLVAAMRDSIPSYRAQHVAANEVAIRAGESLVEAGAHPFWAAAVPA